METANNSRIGTLLAEIQKQDLPNIKKNVKRCTIMSGSVCVHPASLEDIVHIPEERYETILQSSCTSVLL
jgi:hypothetical protein